MIIPILRAARCRSTHHFFAIDALERIGDPNGIGRAARLRDLLLKHYADYLKGAKDPDDTFKDFQNHVLHVSDNNWGGAPKACEQWLETTINHLNARQWQKAAYACGVLSHYFTDPIMPLHTGQSERETVVHRPMEWSICKGYEEIYCLCQYNRASVRIPFVQSSDWIRQAVIAAAQIAHTHYQRLIEIYNLARGTVDPPRGLTKEARQILSELFDLALSGWATVVGRIAAEASVELPDSSLTMATLIAGLDMPRSWVVRKFHNIAEQNAVKKIFDEYAETGTVRDNLPAEIKVVRRELDKARREDSERQAATYEDNPKEPSPIAPLAIAPSTPASTAIAPAPIALEPIAHEPIPMVPVLPVAIVQEANESVASPKSTQRQVTKIHRVSDLQAPVAAEESSLSMISPLVDAPSIGPKTAARFAQIGITTVEQFLKDDVDAMAADLATSWIKPALLADWQAQARLACEVPALCGYKSQLLVAVGCRTTAELASSSELELHNAISDFSATPEAARILLSAEPPDRAEIAKWIQSAQSR